MQFCFHFLFSILAVCAARYSAHTVRPWPRQRELLFFAPSSFSLHTERLPVDVLLTIHILLSPTASKCSVLQSPRLAFLLVPKPRRRWPVHGVRSPIISCFSPSCMFAEPHPSISAHQCPSLFYIPPPFLSFAQLTSRGASGQSADSVWPRPRLESLRFLLFRPRRFPSRLPHFCSTYFVVVPPLHTASKPQSKWTKRTFSAIQTPPQSLFSPEASNVAISHLGLPIRSFLFLF